MIGTNLGHYRLLEKLGHGGMGEVYLAEDTKLKRRLALKVLSADLSGDQEVLDRFQREAESVAALNHPNIVTLYSVEEDAGTHFLTMELVEGETLDHLIPERGLPLDKMFDLAIPLADAMSTAHEKGIIHRDLKPANIMVTEDGRIKILDFGLAKLLDDGGGGAANDDATQALTQAGMVMGTVPYMAPEQVQGKELDRRTDIFSMGVILFEMATGKRPFQGETSADLISAILRDNPAPVTELKVDLPHHLGRIVRHCLEKDPKRRYQAALDIRNELADLKSEVDAGVVHSETTVLPATKPPRPRWLLPALVVAILAIGAILTWRATSSDQEQVGSSLQTEPGQPSIAVLFFDNLSGDPELEWLRNGLTDMLVTDLSQSPDLRVLSTAKLYQILSDMKKLDERITSFEVVRGVAEEADADTVIVGKFAKIGETIRISIEVQEAASGEILQAKSVTANQQDEIFNRIDDLSRNIRQSIELPQTPSVVADRAVAEVSTDSVEAYRFYTEAEALHYETKEEEAIELYKKAVELDPTFAMAWAKLGTSHGNIGMVEEGIRYAEKAIEHVDRLTEPERAYVQGRYYGRSLETYDRAMDVYTTTLAKYPHLTALWNNLAVLYAGLWMNDKAIHAYEQAIVHGDVFPGTYHGLAGAYAAVGEPEKAVAVLEDFLEDNPESFSTLATYAGMLGAQGKLEASDAAVAQAEELRPGFMQLIFIRYSNAVLRGDWDAAYEQTARISELPFPFAQSVHLGLRINLLLYRGQSAEAQELTQPLVDAWPAPSLSRANSHVGAAIGNYLAGSVEQALIHATAAREEGRGQNPDYVAHGLQIVIHERLGDSERADVMLPDFTSRVERIPGAAMTFWLHEVRGRLAMLRGEHAAAVAELEESAAMVPATDNNSARVLYALGEAYIVNGQPTEAEATFRRVLALEGTRAFSGFDYVRSVYQLGRLLAEKGDAAGAREHYRAFVDLWGEGDLERGWVDEARRFLSEA